MEKNARPATCVVQYQNPLYKMCEGFPRLVQCLKQWLSLLGTENTKTPPPKHATSQLHGSLYSYVFKHLCILFETGSDQTGQTGLELKTFLL